MIVISDTSCIINLAIINQLHLLQNLFVQVVIPTAVYNEIVVTGSGKPGALEVQNADWIIVKQCNDLKLRDELLGFLDEGESEALVLAMELNPSLLLIDEEKGRMQAEKMHLRYIGLLGVLIMAKRKGLINKVKPLMDYLRSRADFRISEKLYQEVLKLAKE